MSDGIAPRRWFVSCLPLAVLAGSSRVTAQPGKPVRVAWISSAPQDRGPERYRPLVERHLRHLGWDPSFDVRYAAGDLGRLAIMARDVVAARPDIIVAPDTNGAVAAKKATASIPIVMSSADPVRANLVASLSRPGGNVTGVSAAFDDGIAGKWVELLREIATSSTIAVVSNPGASTVAGRLSVVERSAANVGFRVQQHDIRTPADADRVFDSIAATPPGGLIFDSDLTLLPYMPRILQTTKRHRIPAVFTFAEQAEVGGLLAYGPSLPELYRLLAVYVDRVLRGARPADAPVEQVRKYDLVINLRTAREIAVSIPPALLLRADKIFE